MEWRENTTVSCENAYSEAQRWLEEVTHKSFRSSNFRCALEDGVLLCDLINQLKPGVIKRVNRLSTPIAGLDNVNVFLRACGKLGLNEAQLFHPGDLQDLSTRVNLRRDESNRRLKNVLITIYWLGRKAQVDPCYSGPQLNFRAFEGLLGIALSKALEESSCSRVGAGVRDSGYSEAWYPEKEQLQHPAYWAEESLDALDSLETCTIRASSQGCGSEAEQGFRMERISRPTDPAAQRDRGYIPAPLRRKRLGQEEERRGAGAPPPSPLIRQDHTPLSQPLSQLPPVNVFLQWAYDYHSDSDSDNADRPGPDLVTDDWASRRFHFPTPAPPTNFAIPMSVWGRRLTLGSPQRWAKVAIPLRQALVSPSSDWRSPSISSSCIPTPRSDTDRTLDEEILLRALCERDSQDEDSEGELGEADPILDDLYTRRVEQSLHQTSSNPAFDRFLPQYWTPEEETRVGRIKLGSQRRPWYRKMVSLRPPQVNPGWIWSKSLSDIAVRQWTQQPVRQGSVGHVGMETDIRVKDSEAKWHDDLTKWKNRRRSTTSDLRRKVQDREVTGQLANGNGTSPRLQEKREQQPPRRQASSSSPLDSPTGKEPSAVLRPRTQALLCRGYAFESPCSPLTLQGPSSLAMLPSEVFPPEERSHAVSLAADGAGGAPVSTVDFPLSSMTVKQDRALVVDRPTSEPGWSGPALPEQTRTTTKLSNGTSSTPANSAVPQSSFSTMDPPADTQLLVSVDLTTRDSVPNLHLQNHPPQGGSRPGEEARLNGHHPMDKQPKRGMAEPDTGLYRYSSWSGGSGAAEGKRGGARVSATLPRGFRRSEGSCRLSVVVPPRPFGTKSSLVSTLPRLFKVVNRKSVTFNAEKDQPPTQTSPSSLRQVKSQSWPGDNQSNNSEEDGKYEEEERRRLASLQTKASCTGSQTPVQAQAYPKTHFQTQARGGSATLPCPDTPIPGNRHHIQQRRHSDMRVSLSLKPNSRPDFGFQTQWYSTGAHVQLVHPGSPAEQCQLQVGDEIVAVGGRKVAQMSYKQWEGTMSSAMQTGSLTMDVRRYGNNDWASGASQHQSCHKTVNLTSGAPTLIGRPNQCANEQPEDADVSKTTAETKPIQEVASKGKNGNFHEDPVPIRSREVNRITLRNRKRRAEFFKQKGSSGVSSWVYLCGGSESAISDLQVPSISPLPCSWSWDPEEERRRQERWQEEQDRLLQEKYSRDQERMEAEWQRAQQEAGGEVYRKPEQTNGTVGSVSITQSYLSQPTPPTNGVTNHKNNTELDQVQKEHVWKEAKSEPEKQGEERDGLCEQNNWSGGSSYGFTKLSAADRTKSKSTPVLDGLHKQETKGAGQEERRMRSSQGGASDVEQDRQRILEEMRKRTQLLTDNSWIRQRSSNSIYKEPIYVGVPMRRYESLDNLDTTTPISSSVNQNRPHSAAGYSTPSRMSASRYSLGAGSSEHHPPWSRPPSTSPTPGEEPHSQSQPSFQPAARLVSGSLACCVCERSLGRGAAMVIEALALCFHLACFQCVDCRHPLGRSEDGAQVRIRDRKPYCDPCYLRLRVGPPAFL